MNNNTLVLVHSIVRHGERTPDPFTAYPNDPHKSNKYYPYGVGMLTNEGKRTMYDIGKAFRERYNEFLGDIYLPEYLETWTTQYERCRSSAQILLASLFSPKGIQKWHESLDWQPIPTNYNQLLNDELMGSIFQARYMNIYLKAFENSSLGNEILKENKDIISYIEEHAGYKITNTKNLFLLRDCLLVEEEFGLKLPEWTKAIYPDKLNSLAYQEYVMQTSSKGIRRFVCGVLLKKILTDTMTKINTKSELKMHLYVGHDVNIANVLLTLGIIPNQHFPSYGAAVTFELHKIGNEYGFKIFYKKNKNLGFEPLPLSDGKLIYWLEDFEQFVKDLWDDGQI